MEIPVFNANSVDPDQMLHSVASDLGLHFYGMLGVNGLTLALLNPDIPCLCKQCRSRSVGF